jgi:hypothetical protein
MRGILKLKDLKPGVTPVADANEQNPTEGGEQDQAGITRSGHARLRAAHGRPIPEVANDIQRAGQNDVFVQSDDNRFVVRGPRGREHIVELNGEHVTSVRRPDAAHRARLRDGTIRPATDEEFQRIKSFIQ